MQNEGTLEEERNDDNANQSQWRSEVLHKVPCNLIHGNLAWGENSDLWKHNAFSKSITAELWICVQVPQAAARIGRGAGDRHSWTEMIEPLLRNKISQPLITLQLAFLTLWWLNWMGFAWGARPGSCSPVLYLQATIFIMSFYSPPFEAECFPLFFL